MERFNGRLFFPTDIQRDHMKVLNDLGRELKRDPDLYGRVSENLRRLARYTVAAQEKKLRDTAYLNHAGEIFFIRHEIFPTLDL